MCGGVIFPKRGVNNFVIVFAYEDETKTDKTLPYLNILLHCNNNGSKFSVGLKSTNKNDLINFIPIT